MGDTENQKVLVWARGKMRQRVGKGECWDLAEAALEHAHAVSSSELGPSGPDQDYVWGDPISLTDVRPGDILQFTDFVILTHTETNVDFDDGSTLESWNDERAVRGPHHTAIVDHVVGTSRFKILEQHVKPLGQRVQLHEIVVAPGTRTETTHKSVKDQMGKLKPGKVKVTTTYTISGSVVAYRPKPGATKNK